jgi:hypothetical protein
MRYCGFALIVFSFLCSCSREKTTNKVDEYLQGTWVAKEAKFQAFGESLSSRETHIINDARISFLSNNQFSLQLKDSLPQNGTYKIQATDRSYYNLHLEIWNADSSELRKELWYISGGQGKKWRAEIETNEGWVNFQGVRP